MGEGMRDLTNIAILFITVAALALLVSHPSGTSSIISTTTTGFGKLLSTVENPTGGSGFSANRSVMNTASGN